MIATMGLKSIRNFWVYHFTKKGRKTCPRAKYGVVWVKKMGLEDKI